MPMIVLNLLTYYYTKEQPNHVIKFPRYSVHLFEKIVLCSSTLNQTVVYCCRKPSKKQSKW